MQSITLTDDELTEITGLIQPAAQQRWFRLNYGIEGSRRADGSLSIPRALYFEKAGLATPRAQKTPSLRLRNAS